MTATYLIPPLLQRWVDGNGLPLYLGTINTYQAGSLVPLVTYKDSTLSSPNTNPITLNARGEAAIWQVPNVATKYIVSDSAGNLIATIDNVVNSQLITLYGGVDVGSVNAYVLTFTANFTAYADGIQLTWIPANTNIGASTININGLGVVNIVNPDGSALLPNEIIANQPAQILFKGGAFELITPAITVYGSFTPTWGGFSAAPAVTPIAYRKNGSLVTMIFNPVNGTSNAPSFTLAGIPLFLRSTSFAAQSYPVIGMLDNGARIVSGLAAVTSAGGITFYKDGTQALWTASGLKGFADFVGLTYSQ